MGELIQSESEGSALPRSERRLDLNERAVDSSGGGSETPVNSMFGGLLVVVGQAMASNLLSKDNGRRRLALNTRREDLLGEDFGGCSGESADQAGKRAFEDRAFAGCPLFRSHGDEMRKGAR